MHVSFFFIITSDNWSIYLQTYYVVYILTIDIEGCWNLYEMYIFIYVLIFVFTPRYTKLSCNNGMHSMHFFLEFWCSRQKNTLLCIDSTQEITRIQFLEGQQYWDLDSCFPHFLHHICLICIRLIQRFLVLTDVLRFARNRVSFCKVNT